METVHLLHGKDITCDNKDIPLKFITASIKHQLKNNHNFFELNNSGHFFLKQPVFSDEAAAIDVFGGFILKIRQFDNGNFYMVLNPTFKYIGSQYLSDMINVSNKNYMADRFLGKHCLYQNGDDWYMTEVVGFLNTIDQDEYTGQKIINYIADKTLRHRFNVRKLLRPADLTLLYKYPNRAMTPHHGATSLARIIFHTKDLESTAIHRLSIKPVDERFELIHKMISQYLQRLTFNNKPLKIDSNSWEEQYKAFPIPELLYKGGKVLSVGNKNINSAKTVLKDFPKARKNYIIENQILKQLSFDEQFLIYPQSLDKSFVNAIKNFIESYIKKLAPKFQGFRLIPYKLEGRQAATFQVQEIEKTLEKYKVESGFALFLFDDFIRTNNNRINIFHDCLKKKFFRNIKFQCASSKNLRNFLERTAEGQQCTFGYRPINKLIDKFKSYLFYLVMEYMKINSKWPYALNKDLHYNIWIGIDVLDRYVGFTFFYKNGENIIFRYKEIPRKTGRLRDEKIDGNTIISMLTSNLENQIPRFAPNPNGLVILRDGRIFDEEIRAIQTAVKNLENKGLIQYGNFKWGIVELHKKPALPLRAALKTDGFMGFENVQAGTYRIIGLEQNEGFLFNTGYPFKNCGTVNPISLFKAYGNIDFKKVMEDVFNQCILAFSAPDKSNNLPITIKLIDSFLEPLADNVQTGEEEMAELLDDEEI